MREPETKYDRPSVEELRRMIDERLTKDGRGKRAEALRSVNMSQTTFERILHEGLSKNPREETTKKLRRMGVLDLIPRR